MLRTTEKMVRRRNTGGILSLIVISSLLFLLFSSCATLQKRENIQTERLLSAAGFQMRFADTPKKMAQLEAFRPRTLTPKERNGKLYYVYADKSCGCLYVGTEKAYQRYQRMAEEMQIAKENREAAQMNSDASLDWDMWGPWGPWWWDE
jgi:hypothetical protein